MTVTDHWTLDPSHSEIGFSVRHAGISKVRGSFREVQATVAPDGERAQVKAVAQASSFTTGNSDRDNHVKSGDFLAVDAFPTVDFSGSYSEDELTGDLTIHGVTKPVTFAVDVFGEAVDPFGNNRLGAEATATISRKDFGLTWNAALDAGGVLVGDRVTISLDLSFIKDA